MPLPMRHKLLLRLYQAVGPFLLRRHGVVAPSTVRVLGLPIVERHPGSSIVLQERCTLCSDATFTALGVAHPVVLRTLRPGAAITIGADTGISGAAICSAKAVSIGGQCLIGADVIIADTDFHPLAAAGRRHEDRPDRIGAAPVSIGRNVFIGARAVVLKGVSIGDDTVIGAGSVVTTDIPAGVIAAGNPCRVLGPLPEAT